MHESDVLLKVLVHCCDSTRLDWTTQRDIESSRVAVAAPLTVKNVSTAVTSDGLRSVERRNQTKTQKESIKYSDRKRESTLEITYTNVHNSGVAKAPMYQEK